MVRPPAAIVNVDTGAALTPPGAASPTPAAGRPAFVEPIPAAKLSVIPEHYRVPEHLSPQRPHGLAKRIFSAIALVLYALVVMMPFALLAFLPALIGGVVGAIRRKVVDGKPEGFLHGFADVFRPLTQWVNRPMSGLSQIAFSMGSWFYVDRETVPGTVIMTARIHLTGDPAHIAAVRAIERNIEFQLAIEGYAVNIEFVDAAADDASEVAIDPAAWPDSDSWNPLIGDNKIDFLDSFQIAHELMHQPFGLADEYSHRQHLNNAQLSGWQRFLSFITYLGQPLNADAQTRGILVNHLEKPLPRHYEAILHSL